MRGEETIIEAQAARCYKVQISGPNMIRGLTMTDLGEGIDG